MTEWFPGVELCRDVSPADWVRSALSPWDLGRIRRIASLVPAAYSAHARILHRAWRGNEPVRWSDIAAATGLELTAGTCYNELVGWDLRVNDQEPPTPWREPEPGSLSRDQCSAVAAVLDKFTATPGECWFAVWEGYGWTDVDRSAPRVRLEHRDCLLYRGSVAAATAFASSYGLFQSPTLWWPEDRAWCVASELDIYSTYVAAAHEAVAALVANTDLEVFECHADDPIDPSPNFGPRNPDPPGEPVPPGASEALYTFDESE